MEGFSPKGWLGDREKAAKLRLEAAKKFAKRPNMGFNMCEIRSYFAFLASFS
jgi:hypothetical protein